MFVIFLKFSDNKVEPVNLWKAIKCGSEITPSLMDERFKAVLG